MSTDWDQELYDRFRTERRRPLNDLLSLLPSGLEGSWVDLGCGDGGPTTSAVSKGKPDSVLGIDSSAAMLSKAPTAPLYTWLQTDVDAWLRTSQDRYDVVLSNALLHWLPAHHEVVPRILARLAPGGWLALQMPMNHDQLSHRTITATASDFSELRGFAHEWPQQAPSLYAKLGSTLRHQLCEVRTYRHFLPGPHAIGSWLRSTGMRPWLEQLPPDRVEDFVAAYTERIAAALPPIDSSGLRALDYRRLLWVGQRRA